MTLPFLNFLFLQHIGNINPFKEVVILLEPNFRELPEVELGQILGIG